MSRECCDTEPVPDNSGSSTSTEGSPAARDDPPRWWRDPTLRLPIAAGVLLAVGYGLEWSGAGWPGVTLHTASVLTGAATFVPGAIRRLLRGGLGVGLLMTIAAIGAVMLGHVGEAATLAFLFSIAEALEDRAMGRARLGLRALLSLLPETARLLHPSGDITVPAADIRVGDVLVVRAGERVATDGFVLVGRSSMDSSAVTGESIPTAVGPGDPVPAGSINGAGSIHLEATADGRDNSLTSIVRLVEEAQAKKGARARLADRIARPLVPIVLGVAALIIVFGFAVGDPAFWTERALVVLVAASPCALAIAVPVTVISAVGAASRFGVIIKSGAAFERLGTIRTVAFDKTGTLTRNSPEVVAVATADPYTRDRVIRLAAALEAGSTHPLAAAILAAAPEHPRAAEVSELAGYGMRGVVAGTAVRVGSARWIHPGGLSDSTDSMEAQGKTVVVVEAGGAVAGVIGIRDELASGAADAVRALSAIGIRSVMLTGDNARTAEALGAKLGISDIRAALRPGDKAGAVEELSLHRVTAMIGDGINDAPALAVADVGIAMGARGSAAAVESADVAFMGNDLRMIPQALAHARRGRRIMTGNIALSLAIIVVLFPLALFNLLGLAGVVLIHELAEVVVIANGLRAARGRPEHGMQR